MGGKQAISRNTWSVTLRWAGTILSILLLVILISRQGWQEIARNVQNLSMQVLATALGLGLTVHFWNVLRWRAIYRAQRIDLTYRDALKLMFAAVFASNFLPTTVGGDVLRVVGISREASGRVVSAATVVVDRLVGMLGMTFLLPFSLPILQSFIGNPSLILATSAPGSSRVRSLLSKARNRLIATAAPWFDKPGSILYALIAAWIGIASYVVSVWVVARDLGMEVTFLQVAGATSLTYFISVIPVSVNSYGLRELGVVAVYTALGAGPDQSAALALVTRTLLWAATLPGVIWVGPALQGLGGKRGAAEGEEGLYR